MNGLGIIADRYRSLTRSKPPRPGRPVPLIGYRYRPVAEFLTRLQLVQSRGVGHD